MANQYVSKVVLGSETLIDLTSDTVTADKLAYGVKAHDKSGAQITGTNTYDADTGDATASASEILATKTAYVNGSKLTGTMPNRGKADGTITTKTGQYTIQQGYHDGSGKVSIDTTEQSKIIATNIRQGVTILGVEGSMTGTEDMHLTTKTVTPILEAQTVLPGDGFDGMSQVNVGAIPVTRTDNSAGGVTVTIAA